MKYYLIAGEASGDLHTSYLMKALKKKDPQAEFRWWGGDRMREAGGTMVHHYRELAYMGFWEVLKNLPALGKYIRQCRSDMLSYRPDALILTDYSGFNLRIAPVAAGAGIPVHFYIAPKLWAWNEKRVEKLRKYVDELYVIFPFEKDFFEKKHGLPVHYVGNPLTDVISSFSPMDKNTFYDTYGLDDRPVIALLPGSRTQEIRHLLPVMLPLAKRFPAYQFVIAGAPGFDESFYTNIIRNAPVRLTWGNTYDLLSYAHSAVVTSGTATLETALFKVPQVVVYKTSALSYAIAKRLVSKDLKYISLVNLVAEEKVVEELIQQECRPDKIAEHLRNIMEGKARTKMFEDYYTLEQKLDTHGTSGMVADLIIESLRATNTKT